MYALWFVDEAKSNFNCWEENFGRADITLLHEEDISHV